MKFKATKIATAVAAGLSISAMGMNVAKADSVFFPYFAISPTVTTLLSVINDDIEAETPAELHYRYYANGGAGTCEEFNFWNNTSENDIVTFDLGGVFSVDNTKGVLFEPPPLPGEPSSDAVYGSDFAIMGRTEGIKRGYVLVDNAPRNPAEPVPGPTARLDGEAFLIEFQTGSAWGYRAYNASEIWGLTPHDPPQNPSNLVLLNQYDFSDRVEQNGEVMTAPPANTAARDQKTDYWSPIAIAPWTEGVTAFFVTPVGTTPPFQGQHRISNLTATIELRASATGVESVMFNRDEDPVSGGSSQAVICVGKVLIEDLVNEFVVQSTPQGGWSHLAIRAAGTGQAVVFKTDYNPADPSSLNGVAIDGSYNNVTWLRKGIRESSGRPLVADGWAALPIFNFPGIDNNAPFPVLLANRRASETTTGLPLPPLPGRPTTPYYDPNIFAPPGAVAAALSDGRVLVGSTGL